MMEDQAALTAFCGVARLFPLPNLVVFPGVFQGLHIFEMRYRDMMADALETDQLIAMALLKPDWKIDEYDYSPPIESMACLGRIVDHELFPDGRYNLVLKGLQRFVIEEELETEQQFRSAKGRLIPDVPILGMSELLRVRQQLRDVVLARFEPDGQAFEQIENLFAGEMPLGSICDLLGYHLPLELAVKQQLLSQANVEMRVEILANVLKIPQRPSRTFPPDFSSN